MNKEEGRAELEPGDAVPGGREQGHGCWVTQLSSRCACAGIGSQSHGQKTGRWGPGGQRQGRRDWEAGALQARGSCLGLGRGSKNKEMSSGHLRHPCQAPTSLKRQAAGCSLGPWTGEPSQRAASAGKACGGPRKPQALELSVPWGGPGCHGAHLLLPPASLWSCPVTPACCAPPAQAVHPSSYPLKWRKHFHTLHKRGG